MALEVNADKIKAALENATKKSLTEIGELVTSQAKALAPVDTGQLRDGIYYRVEENNVVVGSPTEHAEAQEFGTPNNKAQPFLTPAFRENKAHIEKILGTEIGISVGDGRE